MVRQILLYQVSASVVTSRVPWQSFDRADLFLADGAAQAVRAAAGWAAALVEKSKGELLSIEVCQYCVCRPVLTDTIPNQPAASGLVDVDGVDIQSGPRPPIYSWDSTSQVSLVDSAEAWASRQPASKSPTGGAVESARQILAMLECPGSREMLMLVANAIDRATMQPELLDAAEAVVAELDAVNALAAATASLSRLRQTVSLLRCRRQAGGLPPPRKEKEPAVTSIPD